MMTHTVQERPEEEPVDTSEGDPRFVTKEQHNKTLIRIYQDEIQAFKELKEEEEREGLSQRRRRWLNRQIDDLRDRISQVKDGGSSE